MNFGVSNPGPVAGTILSAVPWKCITGTERDGVGFSVVIVPAIGAIAAIRSDNSLASR